MSCGQKAWGKGGRGCGQKVRGKGGRGRAVNRPTRDLPRGDRLAGTEPRGRTRCMRGCALFTQMIGGAFCKKKEFKNSLKVGLNDANFAKKTCTWADFSDPSFSKRALRGDFYIRKNR